MKNLKHIDEVFGKTLSDHEESVPPYIWDNIADKLAKKQRRKRIFYLQSAAASVAILVAFLAGYYLTNSSTNNNQFVNQENSQIPVEENSNSSAASFTDNGSVNNSELSQEENTTETKGTQIEITKTADIQNFKVNNSNKNLLAQNNDEIIENDINDREQNFIQKLFRIDLSGFEQNESLSKDISYPDEIMIAYVDFYEDADEIEKDESKKWHIGGSFSPVYSNNNAGSPNNSNVNSYEMANSNTPAVDESGILSYSGGVNLGYKLSERLDVYSGVYYSEIGQVADNVYINEYQNRASEPLIINTSMGDISTDYSSYNLVNSINDEAVMPTDMLGGDWAYPSNTINSKVYQYIELLEIPVILKYKIIDRKFGMNILGGLSTSFLVGNKSLLEYDNTKYDLGETESVQSVNYNSTVGLGFQYDISKKITFNLEPTFKYALNSINTDYKVYPYSFAVFTGVNYRF